MPIYNATVLATHSATIVLYTVVGETCTQTMNLVHLSRQKRVTENISLSFPQFGDVS